MEAKMSSIRHWIVPVLFLLVIVNAAYFLPFARVNYSMHVVSANDVQLHKLDGTPIPVYTESVSLDVMLAGVCGQASKLKLIQDNKDLIMEAGNQRHSQKETTDETMYRNRLQPMLKSKMAERFLCHEGIHDDLQLATWLAAGLVVTVILILTSVLSLLCVVIHTAITIRRRKSPNRNRPSWVVEFLSEAISWFAILASVVYTAFTWNERRSSNSSYGSGYFVMLFTSILISCISAGLPGEVASRCTSALKIFHTYRREKSMPTLPNIVMSDADVKLMADK